MTTVVASVPKGETSRLISTAEGAMLTKDEVEIVKRFVLTSTSTYYGSVDGKLICLWGLIPPSLLSDQAYLWLYTSPAADEHTFVLVRRGQIELKKMLEIYPKIVGHCEVAAPRSIRWLGWLGAKFGPVNGDLVPFIIERQGA